MSSLQHGIIIAKISPFSYNITGFYFTPVGGETKCHLLDPSLKRSNRTVLLSKILSSGAFSKISYRELINPSDSKLFKLALVNMQSSFDSSNLETAIRDDIAGKSWDNYAAAHIDYVSKAIGQNPAERIKQCSGECYVGPIEDIKSYDPFGPIKIYHRDIPILTEEDKRWIKGWTDLFNMSYSDLNKVIPQITLSTAHDPIVSYPNDTLFQAFLISVIDNGTVAGDSNPIKLPLSYRVPPGYIFSGDIHNNEKMLVTWGLNIYDGACWEIALWLLNDSHSTLLDDIRSSRKTTQFASIISNNINSRKANQYLSPIPINENANPGGPLNPTIRNIVYPYDPNGFSFHIISNYYSYDPTTIIPQQWSSSSQHWNNFRPICGENAWFFGLAPFIRNFSLTNFRGYSGFISTLFNMMDFNGGFYYSPLSHGNDLSKLNPIRNESNEFSSQSWSLSSSHNASMYGALSHIKTYLESNGSINLGLSLGQLGTMMTGIKQFFVSIIDRENFFFYHGKTYKICPTGTTNNIQTRNDNSWHVNIGGVKIDSSVPSGIVSFTVAPNDVNMPPRSSKAYVISVNVQIWSICSLQPSVIDNIFGISGAALIMWNNLKQTCGRFNEEGKLNGFGYTNIKPTYDQGMGLVLSSERTFGAMMACKVLKAYYGEIADTVPYSVSSDLSEMESFMYTSNGGVGDNHLLFISDNNEAYYNCANIRAQTGLGCFVNPIPSISSTSWHIFYTKSFNPFVPKGALLR